MLSIVTLNRIVHKSWADQRVISTRLSHVVGVTNLMLPCFWLAGSILQHPIAHRGGAGTTLFRLDHLRDEENAKFLVSSNPAAVRRKNGFEGIWFMLQHSGIHTFLLNTHGPGLKDHFFLGRNYQYTVPSIPRWREIYWQLDPVVHLSSPRRQQFIIPLKLNRCHSLCVLQMGSRQNYSG
jgi:hypothetical protein